MIIKKKSLTLAGMTTSLALLTGCFAGNDEPSSADKKSSAEATDLASSKLESAVEQMTDFEAFEYGHEDLSALKDANSNFRKAIQLDENNNKARLGAAITGVLLAAQSDKLSEVINNTLDAKSPFDSRLTEGAMDSRAKVLRKVAVASALPEFHEIQDAIAETMLPALEDAIGHLKEVYGDASFSMKLTVEGTTIEIDRAEVSVLLAGFQATHALLTLYLSRDIDIDMDGSYDYIETLAGIGDIEDFSQLTDEQEAALDKATSLLKPGSPFLAVRAGWAAKLAKVDDEIGQALASLKGGMASIKTETDDQADDLLALCSKRDNPCVEDEDLDEAIKAIDSASKYLNQPYALQVLDTTIQVNFAAYFNVQDYKKLLPYYNFYPAAQWSNAKPVLYFTDKNGNETANLKSLEEIGDQAEAESWTTVQTIAKLKTLLTFQDPTFQGFLPGATEAGIWRLIEKSAEAEDGTVVAKRAASSMEPNFALSLLGR